jgi:predicted 2-oxoglutarate/Fe(II)-dependent dioxygenase YbiX
MAREWRDAMMNGVALQARVSRAGVSVVDGAYRRSRSVLVPEALIDVASHIVETCRAKLQTFFDQKLGHCQPPVFLLYHPGDFFRPHCDNSGDLRQPAHILARCLTVVLFLNSYHCRKNDSKKLLSDESFSGGELVVYNAMDNPTWDHYYDVISPPVGELVGFRADVKHEVTEVLCGRRFSMATWFEFPRTE